MDEQQARSFQARIATLAELAGSAQVLADRAGLSRRVVGKYLAGESDPSRERLVALADAVGVNVSWLAAGRGPMRDSDRPQEAVASPTIPPANLPKEEIKAWLDEWWSTASDQERTWLPVQMAYCLPPFAEWQKKRGKACSTRCGAGAG